MPIDNLSQLDRDLLDRRFDVDPFSIADVVDRIPKGSQRPAIVGQYNPRGGRKVRCAVCGRACHWKGYLVELADGRQALVAERQCGRTAFGFAWDEVENSFKTAANRQDDLVRLGRVTPYLEAAEAEARGLAAEGPAQMFGVFLDHLRRAHGPLSQALARAMRAGGQLIVARQERDREAEEDYARQVNGNLVADVEDMTISSAARLQARRRLDHWIGEYGQRFKTVEALLGRCAGGDALTPRVRPSALFSLAADQYARASQLSAAGAQGGDLGQALRSISAGVDSVREARGLIESLDAFLALNNLALINRFARETRTSASHPLAVPAGWGLIETPMTEALVQAYAGR